MDLDLAKCKIRTPTGEELLPLYEMLMEAFPSDRPVFTEMITKGKRFYTWTPYALYLGGEPIGNVSLMPMRIWLEGRPVKIVGVASVATRKPYRRRGVARRVLQHALEIIEVQKAPAVLFTGLPAVYEGFGFQAVEQAHRAAPAAAIRFKSTQFDREVLDTLDAPRLEQLARIHADEYPDYDGKVVRDRDYWQLYQMLFNVDPKARVICCLDGGQVVGYVRIEAERDRLLVSEIAAVPSQTDVAEALLGFAEDHAVQLRLPQITLALPSGHFAWQVLRRHEVPLEPEPPGVPRETFMVRPAAGELTEPLKQLQWSLADKF